MASEETRASGLAKSGASGISVLLELLSLAEGPSLEFKRSDRIATSRLVPVIHALANTADGGYLVLGVSDPHDPRGSKFGDDEIDLEDDERDLEDDSGHPSLNERIVGVTSPERSRSSIENAAGIVGASVTVEAHEILGKDVILALVKPGRTRDLADILFGPRRGRKSKTVLVLATEWWSRHGGLSSFNRGLCGALSEQGCTVVCLVPAADPDEVDEAKKVGVRLETPSVVAGLGGPQALLRVPESVPPADIIIGHGRITGSQAAAIAEDRFPAARRIHIVHTVAEEIEWFKDRTKGPTSTRAGERDAIERALAGSAHVIGAVGPLLTRKTESLVRGLPAPRDPSKMPPKVVSLVPGLSNTEPPRRDPPSDVQVLVLGRTEDSRLKGLDIAARAIGSLDYAPFDLGTRPTLVVRGSPADESSSLRSNLSSLANGDVQVLVRDWTVAPELLSADLARAALLLMPSRHEGFGLVGLEAIDAGVPVLVSDTSGLGEVVAKLSGHRSIVATRGPDDRVVASWGRAIDRTLFDPHGSFRRAHDLREVYAAAFSWSRVAKDLLTAVAAA